MAGRKRPRFLTILKYSFYIVMSCLAIINIAFFICNWRGMELHLSKETLMLTVVGFFFAFAGINIYSIFNTNIEFEKQSIKDLEGRYEERLRLSEKELHFPRLMIRTYQTAQYLAVTSSLNIGSWDWIWTIKRNLIEMRDFVMKFKENGQEEKFEAYRADLKDLSQGILVLLKDHQNKVENDSFFKEMPEEAANYKEKLKDLLNFVNDLRSYSYEPLNDIMGGKNFYDKVRKVVSYARRVFKNNK